MPYRYFVDSQGVPWRVWDVVPDLIDRRYHIRRVRLTKLRHPDRRTVPTRRVDMARSRLFFPAEETGWLCFESGDRVLRLRPIPPGWILEPDESLEALRERAARCEG